MGEIMSSICMATYNGEKNIFEQMDSILKQIDNDSEIIVIDDCSKDNTVKIIKDFDDDRIQIFVNEERLGVNKSFEKAIGLAKGKYIFMADQDDIWTEKRYEKMISKLKSSLLVSGNTIAIDKDGKKINYNLGMLYENSSNSFNRNIFNVFLGRAYYYGCAMAFQTKLRSIILPFPKKIESHDLFIAMAANLCHSNYHLEDIVLKRRIHGDNASLIKRSLKEKIVSRNIMYKNLLFLMRRIR